MPGFWQTLCSTPREMKSKPAKTTKKRLHTFIVAGSGFRCLAFRDNQGNLRNFWNDTLIRLPVHFLDPEY